MNETDNILNFISETPSDHHYLWNLSFLLVGALLGFITQYYLEWYRNRKHFKEQKTTLFSDLIEVGTLLIESYCDLAEAKFYLQYYIHVLENESKSKTVNKEYIEYLDREINKYQLEFRILKSEDNKIIAQFSKTVVRLDQLLNFKFNLNNSINSIKQYDINSLIFSYMDKELSTIDANKTSIDISGRIKNEFGGLISSFIELAKEKIM